MWSIQRFHDDEDEVKSVKVGNDMIEVFQEFCYLGDVVGSRDDVQSTVKVKICAG